MGRGKCGRSPGLAAAATPNPIPVTVCQCSGARAGPGTAPVPRGGAPPQDRPPPHRRPPSLRRMATHAGGPHLRGPRTSTTTASRWPRRPERSSSSARWRPVSPRAELGGCQAHPASGYGAGPGVNPGPAGASRLFVHSEPPSRGAAPAAVPGPLRGGRVGCAA
jgi:hypothetical protein